MSIKINKSTRGKYRIQVNDLYSKDNGPIFFYDMYVARGTWAIPYNKKSIELLLLLHPNNLWIPWCAFNIVNFFVRWDGLLGPTSTALTIHYAIQYQRP